MIAIFKREFKAYFTSMLGYVFLMIYLFLSGIMFFLNNMLYQTTSMLGYFSGMISLLIFILPILTMRMFSEDKKLKTDQLLITAPIGIHEMVIGKYFAAICVFFVGTAVAMLYPVILSFYGTVNVAETVSCFVGFILFTACIVSIGAYMSSITDSQVVAAISTYCVVILIMLFSTVASQINNAVISKILLWIDPLERFFDFTSGILNIESIIYYISVAVIFIFMAVRTFEKKRWN